MEPNVQDGKEPEKVVDSSPTEPVNAPNVSEDGKTQVAEAVKSEFVPKWRFNEVNEELKELKTFKAQATQAPVQPAQPEGEYQDPILVVKQIAAEESRRVKAEISSEMELNNAVAQLPDFMEYKEAIKAKIQANPYLSWNDAYTLAKSGTLKEEGKREAYAKIAEKQGSVVEGSTSSAKKVISEGKIDPMAKGPDGKYLYSLKELEEQLPHA